MTSSNRLAAILSTLLVVAVSACVDPPGRYGEYVDKTTTERTDAGPTTDAAPLAEIPDVTGPFLLALKIAPLGASLAPIQASVTTTFTKSTAKLDLLVQFLTVQGRTATGTPIDIKGVAVNNAGQFTVELAELKIPKAANPVGADAIAEGVKLFGTIKTKDLYCGTAHGQVVVPTMFKLEDQEPANPTTYAVIRVTDTSNLPSPVFACPTPDAGP